MSGSDSHSAGAGPHEIDVSRVRNLPCHPHNLDGDQSIVVVTAPSPAGRWLKSLLQDAFLPRNGEGGEV